MNENTIQRLYGVIGGVCAVRAAETAFLATETALAANAEIVARFVIAVASGFPAICYGIFAIIYLKANRIRWVHYAFIAMEIMFIAFLLHSVRLSYVASDGQQEVQRLFVYGTIYKMLVSGTMLTCVIVILNQLRLSSNKALEPTTTVVTPPAGQEA